MSSETRAQQEEPSITTEASETGQQPGSDDPATTTVPTELPELTLDVVLEVAKNERRRRITQYLIEQDSRVDIGVPAEHLAAVEYDCPDTGPTSTQRKRLYVGLYQGHLPKMHDMGVVRFDKDRGSVETGPHAREIARFLEHADCKEPPWPRRYLGLAGLAGALYGAALVWPASTTIATLGLALVIGLLVLTAGTHVYSTRTMLASGDLRHE